MPSDVRVVLNDAAIAALADNPEVRDLLLKAAEPAVRRAQATAPHRTGLGAASIHAEAVLDGPGWTVRVGWERDRYYMFFHERGTKHLDARPFLVPGFE